ncbi:RAD52 motif-containing protein 1-like isoform X2 [Asterias amurensis]|uniref:RAD52 motif-containing protein 1-like isoform X2 n=1 Tax=Asterias amurensis TaxID=7602 RepID=UPI003AB684E0
MASSPDIIEFVRPDTNDKNLYVTRISNKLTEPAAFEKLHHIFSQFGLLYEVQVLEGRSQPVASEGPTLSEQNCTTTSALCGGSTGSNLYAFIKYYSTREAQKAQQAVNGKYMLEGRLLRVRFANRQHTVEASQTLYHQQCYELASHYLGFNGWSSKIESLKEDKASCEPNTARFIGIVRINVTNHGVHSDGIGVGEVAYSPEDLMSKITAFHRAKKLAIQRASEGAFSKVLIVVLANGKVAVEINSTSVDALHFVTQEELKGVVTQINPTEETDCPGPDNEGALDADDTSDLDNINVQLLLDLQEEDM